MPNRMDLTGQRFGRLVVERYSGNDSSGHSSWICKCDCGNTKEARGSHLKRGYIQSCGCLATDMLRERSTKHGLEHTRLYRIWSGMLKRCYNTKSNRYQRYGGRGITVCQEWRDSIEKFVSWSISNGYRDELTLDRIDNDGPYSPENCRWATMKEQTNHTRRNRLVTIGGVTKTISQWAEEKRINIGTVYSRLKRGWSVERALNDPVKKQRKGGIESK